MKTKKEYKYILRWFKKLRAINFFGGKCQKCGEKRVWLLSFHHKNPNEKEIEISRLAYYRWSKIQKELCKCELLCERCHREIHNQNKETGNTQSKKILLKMKSISGCEICGYNHFIGALDFHHENNKDFDLGKIRISETSENQIKEKILNELEKCKVLCANCHYDLHFDKEVFEQYRDEIENWNYTEIKEPLDKKAIIRMYKKGIIRTEIAKQMGRNLSVISSIIKRHNKLEALPNGKAPAWKAGGRNAVGVQISPPPP